MQQPKTSYARNGDVNIAYQVVGEGPRDVVFVPGFISHLDLWWTLPDTTALLRRLSSFSRLILFDKRGTGLSDPVPGIPTLEERMEDLHAVLDAAGSERTALFGVSEGGPMSILYAATYPERVTAMVLYGTSPRLSFSDSFLPEKREFFDSVAGKIERLVQTWGEGHSVEVFAPTLAGDPATRRTFGLFERAAASPSMADALFRSCEEIDTTRALPVIDVPTTVIHRRGDPILPIEAARLMAEEIPGARLVELDGDDHLPWLGDRDGLVDAIEEAFTGAHRSRDAERVLATVLFTDIVGSTQLAAELGDRRWRELLEAHDESVRRRVDAHGGRVVKSLGDGYLATFDGPAKAIRCARALAADAESLGIRIRAGVHTGECEVIQDDVGGMAVHIGARVMAQAEPGEVIVSSAVRDLVVGAGIEFEERGSHELKGVPGEWTLLAVAGEKSDVGARARPSEAPDRLAPNQEVTKPGDRVALRLARNAPSVARFVSRVTTRRRREPDEERHRTANARR